MNAKHQRRAGLTSEDTMMWVALLTCCFVVVWTTVA